VSFLRGALTVGGLTLVSRLAGFVRDLLTAAVLGAGPLADAFFVALKLPNFLRRFFAEGAFAAAFVPMVAERLEREGKTVALAFAGQALGAILLITGTLTLLAILAMPALITVLAPGFGDDPIRHDAAVDLARVTFIYLPLISAVALIGGLLNSVGRLAPFAAAPILFNLTLIAALLGFVGIAGDAATALAWGVAVSGVVQLGVIVISARRAGVMPKPVWPRGGSALADLWHRALPGAVGAGVQQINVFVDMILASLLPVGAVTFLYFADRLMQLPLGVIGIALGTAILPLLSRAIAAEDEATARRLFSQGMETAALLGLPAAIGLMLAAEPMVTALFQRGAFTERDAQMTALALTAYAIGVPAMIGNKVLAAACFARADTRTPVKIAIAAAVTNTVLGLILIWPLAHVGLALATGVSSWMQTALLIRVLLRRGQFSILPDARRRLQGIMKAGIALAVVLALVPRQLAGQGVGAWTETALLIGLGGGAFGAVALVTGAVDRTMLRRLRRG